MKKLTSICSLFLVGATLFTMLTACGEKPVIDEDPTTPLDEEDEVRDMYGADIQFWTYWNLEFYPEEISTSSGEAQRKRINDVASTYNCNISVVNKDYNWATNIMTDAMTGEFPFSFCDIYASDIYNLYKAGLLTSYEEMEHIDLTDTEKWGTEAFRMGTIFNGESYGVWPLQWGLMPGLRGVMFYNPELLTEYNAPDPYELLEQKAWTFETFKEQVQNCSDPSAEDHVYGLTYTALDMLTNVCIFANGGSRLIVDETGKYKYGLSSQEAIGGLEYAAELISMTDSVKDGGSNISPFSNGVATYCVTYSWHGTVEKSAGEVEWAPIYHLADFNWINFPFGPLATYGETYSNYIDSTLRKLAVPSTVDTEEVSFIMNELFKPLDGYEGRSAWKEYAETNLFFHKNGFDTYVKMFENTKYLYDNELGSVTTKISAAIQNVAKGNGTVGDSILPLEETINAELEAINNK